jgi:hypothetical protein
MIVVTVFVAWAVVDAHCHSASYSTYRSEQFRCRFSSHPSRRARLGLRRVRFSNPIIWEANI